jgi:hypothetical protein
MPSLPVLLVSCTRCQLLHAPLRDDAANPMCSRCVLPAQLTPPRRARARIARSRGASTTR